MKYFRFGAYIVSQATFINFFALCQLQLHLIPGASRSPCAAAAVFCLPLDWGSWAAADSTAWLCVASGSMAVRGTQPAWRCMAPGSIHEDAVLSPVWLCCAYCCAVFLICPGYLESQHSYGVFFHASVDAFACCDAQDPQHPVLWLNLWMLFLENRMTAFGFV